MIMVNVYITVLPQNRDLLLEKLHVLEKESRKESECISYTIYERKCELDKLFIQEQWVDIDALQRHQQTSHYKQISPFINELSESKHIKKYNSEEII